MTEPTYAKVPEKEKQKNIEKVATLEQELKLIKEAIRNLTSINN